MILTEAHFTEIKSKIKEEIQLAQKHIYVAVAWFTDEELFQALLQKQNEGVLVSLAFVKDEINFGDYGLNYNSLTNAGGKFFAIEGNLMHNKFCVIDGRILITGSYNWTRKAATSNLENIVITYDDFDLAHKYIEQFQLITGSRINQSTGSDIGRILKRLQVIKNFISLEEDEDLQMQATRLKKDADVESIADIIKCLTSKEYSKAILLIDELITKYSQVVIYENPLLIALRLELRDLEYRSIAIDAEINEKEKVISFYNYLLNKHLGELLEEILQLKKEYAFTHRQESQYSESEYQEAKRKYERYSQQREHEEQEVYHELNAPEKASLKALYKEAAVLCHPDKFQGSNKEHEAEEMFKELGDAYRKQDMHTVQSILNSLRRGYFSFSPDSVSDVQLLQVKVGKLRANLLKKTSYHESLAESEVYTTAESVSDYDVHFKDLKSQLEEEYEYWRTRIGKQTTATSIQE